MLNDLLAYIKKDLYLLKKDYWSIALYTVVPVFCIFFITMIFSSIYPRSLGIAVLDLDNTNSSRALIFNVDATPDIEIKARLNSMREVKAALDSGELFGALIIPKDLEANINKGLSTAIPFYYNAQFLLVGKSIFSSYLNATGYTNVVLSLPRFLIQKGNLEQAKSEVMPIMNSITALYNKSQSYANYLLIAILPCVIQIFFAINLCNALDRAIKHRFFNSAFALLWPVMLTNIIITFLYFLFSMSVFYLLNFPFVGSFFLLSFAYIIMAIALGSVICFLKASLIENARTMSFIAAYTAPSFAFVGITYPTNSMPMLADLISHALPISYFLQLYLEEAKYGLGTKSFVLMGYLSLFFVFSLLAGLILKYRFKANKLDEML